MSVFNSEQEPAHKVVEDYGTLTTVVHGLWALNYKIVFTIGSWDLLHIGHVRYLRNARAEGDVLVVGVDSDEAVKRYKGPLRPVVPYEERLEMLTYQSCVNLVTKIEDVDEQGKWMYGLIRAINPDVFVAVEDSYPPDQLTEIGKYCKRLTVLPRQAERTSTTRMIQGAVKMHLTEMLKLLEK